MDQRRSGRERKEPKVIYEVTEFGPKKKREPRTSKASEESDEEEEEEEEEEREEEEEEDEEEEESQAQAKKGKSKGKAQATRKRAPAKKKRGQERPESSSEDEGEGGANLEEVNSPKKKGRGRAKAMASVAFDPEANKNENAAFWHILKDFPTDLVAREWVETYNDKKAPEFHRQIFNFLVWSCGGVKNYFDKKRDLADLTDVEWEELVEGLVEELHESELTTYPLIEGQKKQFKKFRDNFRNFWFLLVKACRAGGEYHMSVLEDVLAILSNMCKAALVSVRHTTTFAGMVLASAIVKENQEIAKKIAVANRQLQAEESKSKGGRTKKAASLNKQIQELTSQVAAFDELLTKIFNQIFVLRYRDSSEKVREDAMIGLGDLVTDYPAMFLKDNFMKYLGWTLYDKVNSVRLSACKVLNDIYSMEDNLSSTANFTARFLDRFFQLADDIYPPVQAQGVEILRILLNGGFLEEVDQETLDQVDELCLNSSRELAVRKASLRFFTDHLEEFQDIAEQEEEKKGKRKSRNSPTSKSEKVSKQLTAMVQFLDYHLGEDYQVCLALVHDLVDAFEGHPAENILYSWSTYYELLKEDQKDLTEREQTILVKLLTASVQKCHTKAGERSTHNGRRGKKEGKEEADMAAEFLESFTSDSVKILPKLIMRFQTNEEKLGSLITLPLYLQSEIFTTTGHKSSFVSMIKIFKDIYCTSTKESVLLSTAKSLRCLLDSHDEKLHEVEVIIEKMMEEICKKVSKASDVKKGGSPAKRKRGGNVQETENEEFSLGISLLRLRCLCTQIDPRDYVTWEEVQDNVSSVVSNRLAAVEDGGEEADLELMAKVIEEGSNVLFTGLIYETSSLVNTLMDKSMETKKGKEETPEDEEEEEEEEVDDEVKEMLNQVVKDRDRVIGLLTDCLSVKGDDSAASQMSGSEQRSTKGGVALRRIRKYGFKMISDLRFLCKQDFENYQVLDAVAWSPDTEVMQLLQQFFEEEERTLSHNAQDDEGVERELLTGVLDPLIRSVIYTIEHLNKRQAAAIASHFIGCGKNTGEAVKWFMKKMKDYNVKRYLEVQMTTLRIGYAKWGNPQDVEKFTKFTQLSWRLAQALGVGKIPQRDIQESFLRFMKEGVRFSFEDSPKNLTFLNAMHHYVNRLPGGKKKELIEYYESQLGNMEEELKAEAAEILGKQWGEDVDDLNAEWKAFLVFHHELLGKEKIALPQSRKPGVNKPKDGGQKTGAKKGRKRRRSKKDEEDEEDEEEEEEDFDNVEEKGSSERTNRGSRSSPTSFQSGSPAESSGVKKRPGPTLEGGRRSSILSNLSAPPENIQRKRGRMSSENPSPRNDGDSEYKSDRDSLFGDMVLTKKKTRTN